MQLAASDLIEELNSLKTTCENTEQKAVLNIAISDLENRVKE